LSGFLITVSVCEANEAPDFAEAAEQGKSFMDSLKFTSKNEEVYSKRKLFTLYQKFEYMKIFSRIIIFKIIYRQIQRVLRKSTSLTISKCNPIIRFP
jgi:hypothetical protein